MKRIALASCLLSLAACATTGTSPKAAGDASTKSEVVSVLTREVAPLGKHDVKDPNGFFTAQAESAGDVQVTESGGLHQVVIPIGTEQPVRCFIYPKAINLAQTLRLFVNSVVTHVDKHQIDTVDAGQINGMPYLALATSYIVEQGAERGGGQVKYIAARGENTTTLCMHDEPGYNDSFKRITTGFIGSQNFGEADSDPARKLLVWRSLSVQHAAGKQVGIVESRLYEGEAGYAFASSRSVILPAEDGTLMASDEAENQFSNSSGDILEAKYVKITNDAVAYNLGLSLDSETSYRVDGTVDGKALDTRLEVKGALPDFATQTAQLRKLFATKGAAPTAHWLTYLPTAPTKLTDVDFERKGTPEATGTAHAGVLTENGVKTDVEVDDMGTTKTMRGNDGVEERVWQNAGEGHS